MIEKDFQEMLIRDLKNRGVNVVNLSGGTFDLIVEGKRPYVGEIKKMAEGIRGFVEDKEGFRFTEGQTTEIRNMEYPPFVVVFTEDYRYYLLSPEWIKEQVEDLKEFATAIMMPSARQFPPAKTYKNVLDKIIKLVS